MAKTWYEKPLWKNITKHYRATEEDIYDKINREAQIIASKLGISDRVDAMAKRKS